MFVTKPYSDPCCYDNNMTKTGLWQEIFLMMLLSRTSQKYLAHEYKLDYSIKYKG